MKNEDQIFKQISKGDKHAYEQLFRSYYAPLCLFAHKYLPDNDDCEEVVQGLFVKIWEKRSAIIINTSVRSYLFGAVRNHCINYINHQKIKQEHHDYTLRSFESEKTDDFNFPEIELMQKIEESIAALPPRRQEIFRLSREEGLKYNEIAERLGLSVKTVETHLGLALRSLRESLKHFQKILITFFMFRLKGETQMNCRNNREQIQ